MSDNELEDDYIPPDDDELEDEETPEEWPALHAEAMQEYRRIQEATYPQRELSLEDRKFVDKAGSQYDGLLFRNFDNKPKLEFNKLSLSVMRIINEYRNNPITVDFVSKDGAANDNDADTCDGLFRADMQGSTGDLAILNAFEEAVKGGLGALRATHQYEDDEDPDNEAQRIKIEPIYEADTSVYFDLDAKNQDKSDAKHCFVLYSMTPQAYEKEYKYSPVSMDKDTLATKFEWFSPDVVYIAEWYRVEMEEEKLEIWKNLAGEEEKHWADEFKENPGLRAELKAVGSRKVRTRKVERRKVHKYFIDGARILEDCGTIAGRYIPIIPVYGVRSFIDNVEWWRGHVRMAKDPQRLFNMQVSKMAEQAALSSMPKPILNPEQINGHETLWAEDNIKDNPYLLVNAMLGPDGLPVATTQVAYTQSAPIPPAQAALIQFTDGAMKEILGANQEMQSVPANTSSEAIAQVFNRMDMQVYMYVSNLAKALRWLGEVWLSMARELYTEKGRKMKTIGKQGEVSSVTLMEPTIDKETGATIAGNDITKATFEVVSSVGPSSTTKKQATVDTLIKILPAVAGDPEMTKMISSLILLNTEGEGLQDAHEYTRATLVKSGVLKPTDDEAEAMAAEAENAEPSATDQAQLAFAQAQQAAADKTRAQVIQVLAEVEKLQADTELTRVEALEKMQNIDQSQREHAMTILNGLSPKRQLPNGPTNLPKPAT